MSERVGEDDVDWAPVDDEECEKMFADSDDEKEGIAMVSGDEATHPSTQFTGPQSSDEEEESSFEKNRKNANHNGFAAAEEESSVEEETKKEDGGFPAEEESSVEEETKDNHDGGFPVEEESSVDERKDGEINEEESSVEETKDAMQEEEFPEDNWEYQPARPSWVTNDSTVDSGPLPKDSMSHPKPPPFTLSPAKITSNEVERLSPGTSRLASFSAGLKDRFSAPNITSGRVGKRSEEGGGTKRANEDDEEDDFQQEEPWPGDDAEDEGDNEAEGGDVFSSEVKPTIQAAAMGTSAGLAKELSSNSWMKFNDDEWDGSEPVKEGKVANRKPKAKTASFSEDTVTPTPKKKKTGTSLADGLAKVSEKSPNPGAQAPEGERNEVVSFWGEGEEEEEGESADDPLAMALKNKPAEPRPDPEEERKAYESKYSQLSSPHSKKEPDPEPGWLQKGIGSAMNMVASTVTNLPFAKPKDTDQPIKDDNVEEVVEDAAEEVDDMPFPNYTNIPVAASQPASAGELRGRSASMITTISGISDDSAFKRSGELPDMPTTIETNAGITTLRCEDLGYDPMKAVVDKMIDQSEDMEITKGIKFTKDTKLDKETPDVYPIVDLFIDLPHPSCDSKTHEGLTTFIGAPTDAESDVAVQNDIRDNMEDISCLAFPEQDSSIVQEEQEAGAPPQKGGTAMDVPGFQHYTFTLKLDTGLVYGHVRRYLPPHKHCSFRYDLGRRHGRAMVLFTRFPGGDDFFAVVLKTLDAIASQHHAMGSAHISRPQKWFLQNLHQKHLRLCYQYATNYDDRRGGPHILTLQGLEFADCLEHYATVDATHFFLPTCLLHKPVIPGMKTSHTCSVLPVIRCLGVVNALRLLSALLCERRIILVSISPTRLDKCVRAAIAILSQGMLNWGHVCVPVLPPDLWSILKSPEPYIIGILAPLAYRLELTDRLGDVVIFDLDENTVTAMGDQKLPKLVPDLCRSLSETMLQKRRIALPDNVATEKDMTALAILNSTSDFLAQDLCEILKADKQTMNGTSVAAKHVAKKAKKVVKSTLNFIWGGGKKDDDEDQEPTEAKKTKNEKRMEPDAIYIEGCRNEAGEEAARLAFVSFFLRLLGNHEGYVFKTEDSDFNFDKEKFLQERKERGDGGGSPAWTMLKFFCEGAMIRDFARLREEHIRARNPVPMDAPLFWQCIGFLQLKDIDFGILNIRSVARMMLQKTSVQQMLPSNVRRLAMAITSKRKFEGHMDEAISDLAELSRESASAFYDVMSVIWLRTRDCKGLQWVHGYQAMKVLREVLLNGPLAAVADATDGIQRIRTLAFRRSQGYDQIHEIALEILTLLCDRSRLFLRRRVAAEKRRKDRDPDDSPLLRDSRINFSMAFKDIHSALNPALRPKEPTRRRTSLSSKRASLSSRLPHRLSITKHIMALEPMGEEDSIASFSNILPNIQKRHEDFMQDTMNRPPGEMSVSSLNNDLATARRYVREVSRKTKDTEKERTREVVRRRDTNAMGVELLKKQFMLLKVAIYVCPIFYIFGNHEHFLTIVMFLWLSQQLQVFRAPIDSGAY